MLSSRCALGGRRCIAETHRVDGDTVFDGFQREISLVKLTGVSQLDRLIQMGFGLCDRQPPASVIDVDRSQPQLVEAGRAIALFEPLTWPGNYSTITDR